MERDFASEDEPSAVPPAVAPYDVVILGGGLSGLTAAHQLREQGRKVLVLERSPRAGGVIETTRTNGFLCEAGPNSMLIKSPEVESYLERLGLGPSIVSADQKAARRYLVRDGKPIALPSNPLAAVATPLYPLSAKLRLLGEPWRAPSRQEDTSVAEFVRRRMGQEFLDYAVAPMVSGIFAGDSDYLSIRHAFPKVWELEAQHQSLIRGALALRKQRRKSRQQRYAARLIAFAEGLETLPRTQAQALGPALVTAAEVLSIRPNESGGWLVEWRTPGTAIAAAEASKVIVTAPAPEWLRLPFRRDLRIALAALAPLAHPPVATLVLGFKRAQVRHPLDGFGMLLPPREGFPIMGTIFSSTLFPDRAPEGHVALMNFLGGALQPDIGRLAEGEALETTLKTLHKLLGVSGDPVFVRHTRWERAIPQYHVGYSRFLHSLAEIETGFPGLHFLGSFRGGPGLNDVVANGLHLADRLSAAE